MIRETLSAIGLASRRALNGRFRRQPWSTNVAHVREWSFAMPHLARVTVANSPLHQVYVGFSRNLVQNFGKDEAARQQGVNEYMQSLKDNLLASLPARRPIVKWEFLEPSAEPQVLRGVRSFILRHHSDVGNLYLMSDLASRQEYESLRDEDWADQVAAQQLPADIGRIDSIENNVMLDRVSTYLTRCEQDVELLIPGPDGEVHAANGVVLQRYKDDGGHGLQISLDLDRRLGLDLLPGMEVEGAFGASGRVFRFRTKCRDKSELNLEGLGVLPCLDLVFPSRFNLDQRRRYFRVEPKSPLNATLHVPSQASEAVVAATVVDLSFSGAGLTVEGKTPAGLGPDVRVQVELNGSDLSEPLVISGMVRRFSVEPRGRGRETTHLGLEFVVADAKDRQSTQKIRQYVMAQQRSLLSSRSRDVAGATP